MIVAVEDIENTVGTIKVGDTILGFRMEERILKYYKCDLKGHIRALKRNKKIRRWLMLHCL